MASHELSGSVEIDKLFEWNIQLKYTNGLRDNTILNLSISEESNSLVLSQTKKILSWQLNFHSIQKFEQSLADTIEVNCMKLLLEPIVTDYLEFKKLERLHSCVLEGWLRQNIALLNS